MTMKHLLTVSALLAITMSSGASNVPAFDTTWIPTQPEVLTYRSTGKQGDGLYQVSVWRTPSGIELYINIITTGFTKSVWGSMSADLHPRSSKSRIVVDGQVTMTTDCSYKPGQLHIATAIAPFNQVMDNTLPNTNLVVDFSQTPLVARVLPLKPGADFQFTSLSPKSNTLVPLTLRVAGEETIQNIECYKIEGGDFEGQSTYWIEKAGHHRVVRIEQPEASRTTELIL